MSSKGLKQFKRSVGDAVHSINTICVGLDGVAKGEVSKSDTLTISWRTNNPSRCAQASRNFAIRSGLIYVSESLKVYIDYMAKSHTFAGFTGEDWGKSSLREKIETIDKHLVCEFPYWVPIIKLLIVWRNIIVHDSSTNLKCADRKCLLEHEDIIYEKHSKTSIKQTLSNLDSNQITLKDFSTIMAITIKFVCLLDEYFEVGSTTEEGLIEYIVKKDLVTEFFNILGVNGDEKQRKKFDNFIKCHFSYMLDKTDNLYDRRLYIKDAIRKMIS